jgi:hypothetical protein
MTNAPGPADGAIAVRGLPPDLDEAPDPPPWPVTAGRQIAGMTLLCLLAVGLFLYFQRGPVIRFRMTEIRFRLAELQPYLIPIWSTGAAGILLVLLGWWQQPLRLSRLDPLSRQFVQCRGVVRLLASLICCLVLAVCAVVLSLDEVFPLRRRLAIGYLGTCYSLFSLYLFREYQEHRDRSMTTYLATLSAPLAWVLIPLTWPLVLCARLRQWCSQRA